MKRSVILLAIVAICLGAYFLYETSQNKNLESEGGVNFINDKEQSMNFIEDKDKAIQDTAQEYKKENPNSNLDVEAILQQTSNLTLITSALRAYSTDKKGIYPSTLSELVPNYTPAMMFPNGQIPLDNNNVQFDYKVSSNGLSYSLCYQDLEAGGVDCVKP